MAVAAIVMSCILAGPVRAESEVPVYSGDAKAKFGHPRQMVEPVYPTEALSAGRGGAVTVTGPVSAAGVMESPVLVPDGPASEDFVGPLRDALAFWLFETPYGNDCMPSRRPISIKVEFEVRDAKPHIYVTVAANEPVPSEWAGAIASRQTPAIRFPSSMIHENREAYVFSRSEVGPDGKVIRVFANAYPKPGAMSGTLTPFVREVEQTLSQWKYPENPAKPLRKVCHRIDFNLVD